LGQARDEIERLNIIIQSLQNTNISLLEKISESRALTDALVDSLPKCDQGHGPATKAYQRGGRRFCDKCWLHPGDREFPPPDYPRAAPLRAIQKDRAEGHDTSSEKESPAQTIVKRNGSHGFGK
jgi:hypothetical protein